MKPQDRILKAFWQRGRKCFVPLMGAEIERRAKVEPGTLRPALRSLVEAGKIATEKANGGANVLSYELTEAGRSDAMRLIGAMA